jgi:hypothetical protein
MMAGLHNHELRALFGLQGQPHLKSDELDFRAFAAISSREEAEYLLMLDHSGAEQAPEWRAFLVEAIVGFLVWQCRPAGEVSEPDLDWFLGLVADAPSPALPALLYALVREMNDPPARVTALALKHARGRCI